MEAAISVEDVLEAASPREPLQELFYVSKAPFSHPPKAPGGKGQGTVDLQSSTSSSASSASGSGDDSLLNAMLMAVALALLLGLLLFAVARWRTDCFGARKQTSVRHYPARRASRVAYKQHASNDVCSVCSGMCTLSQPMPQWPALKNTPSATETAVESHP